jgi:predicted DNA-binding transcriptional regulator YafY
VSVAGGSLPAVNRTDRLYAVVEELRAVAPRPRPAWRLARKYEVSTRTIERDILAPQDAGVPVYAQPSPPGGPGRAFAGSARSRSVNPPHRPLCWNGLGGLHDAGDLGGASAGPSAMAVQVR